MWLPSCVPGGLQVVIGGVMIHLVLGSLYLWGNITVYVTSYLRQFDPTLEFSDTLIVYATTLVGQSCFMPIGGVLESKYGVSKVLFAAQILQTSALLLAANAKSLSAMILAFGMFGAHSGLAYSCPLTAGFQWLPAKKGLVSGFVIGGYGCNAVIFNQVTTFFMNPDNISPDIEYNGSKYYSPEIADKTPKMFYLLAICYFTLFSLGSLLVRYPPKNKDDSTFLTLKEEVPLIDNTVDTTRSEQQQNSQNNKKTTEKVLDLPSSRVICEPVLWNLGFSFVLTSLCGTVILGTYKTIGMDYFDNDKLLSQIGSFAAVANCVGRIFWGAVCDKIGFQKTLYNIAGGVLVMVSVYDFCTSSELLFAVGTFAIVFFHSGNFPIYPAGAASVFGTKYSGGNIGLMYSIWGAFSMLGIFLIPKIDVEFQTLCYFLAGLQLLGLLSLFILSTCNVPSYMKRMREEMKRVEFHSSTEYFR